MALATLSIDLVAQTAKFEADMNRAAAVVQGAAARMDRAFAGVGSVFTGSLLSSAAEEAIRGVVRLYPALIEGVAHFQDLEEQTGASAEALASFTTAGDVAGVSADQLAGYMVKLTANLSTTSEESGKTARALKVLGIDMAAFRQLAPEQQFQQLAQSLAGFQDGAGKTAIAVALLGKSGAQALPFLKELAATGLSQNRLTAEQIRLADEYADRQARVRSELKQAAQIAALQTLPAFTALTEELSKAAIQALGLDSASADLKNNTGLRDFAQGGAIAVATLAESLVGLARLARAVAGSFESVVADARLGVAFAGNVQLLNKGGVFNAENRAAFKQALDDRNRVAAEANERYVKLFTDSGTQVSDALRFQFSEAGRIAARIQADPRELARRGRTAVSAAGRPALPVPAFGEDGAGNKAAREAEQVRKAQLDAALRALEAAYAQERDAIQFQQRYLDAQYQAGLVTLRDYYAQRDSLEQSALDRQLAFYDQQAAALQASLDKTADPSERIKVQERISDVEAKAASARQQFSQQTRLNTLEEERGYAQATDRLLEFRAQVLELQGDLAQAAELRANLAIEQARRSSASLGVSGASAQDLAAFENATRAANAFADAQRNVNRITERQSIEEQRIALQARVSGASRTEVEQQLYAARQRALGQLADELRRVEAIAAAAGPDSPAVQFAQQLRLEFERLQVTLDPALERLRDFGDEVADAFGRAAGAISLNVRDAKSALKSLGDTLLQITARELVERPIADLARQAFRGVSEGQGSAGQLLRGAFGVGGAPAAPAGAPLAGLGVTPFNPNAALPSFGGGGRAPAILGGGGPAVALATLSQAAAAASAALGGSAAGGSVPSLGGLFSVFDTSGAGTPDAPSAERDLLRRIEAGVDASLEPVGQAIDDVLPSFADLDQGLAGAAQGLGSLPQLLQGLLGSLGGGAGAGGLFASVAGLFGFREGGFTGAGAPDAPAGVVHAGEYVISAPAVRRIGVADLERLHRYGRGGAPRSGLAGYADGGLVAARAAVRTSAQRGTGGHYDFRGANFGGGGAGDRASAERQAVLTARAIRREVERHSA
jgi:hypothetical protein